MCLSLGVYCISDLAIDLQFSNLLQDDGDNGLGDITLLLSSDEAAETDQGKEGSDVTDNGVITDTELPIEAM